MSKVIFIYIYNLTQVTNMLEGNKFKKNHHLHTSIQWSTYCGILARHEIFSL